MPFTNLLLRPIGWAAKAAFFLFFTPLVIAAVLSLFYGPAPLTILAIAYVHILAWPFEVHSEFNSAINYAAVIERSRVDECKHTVLLLHADAQPQPFALEPYQFDWQPQRGGPPESQAVGDESWNATPLSDDALSARLWELTKCGISTKVHDIAKQALSEPGSWVAQDTRGSDDVMIYSAPHTIAIKFSNET